MKIDRIMKWLPIFFIMFLNCKTKQFNSVNEKEFLKIDSSIDTLLATTLFMKNGILEPEFIKKNEYETIKLVNILNKEGFYDKANELSTILEEDKSLLWQQNNVLSDFRNNSIEEYCNELTTASIILINDHHLYEASRFSVALFLHYLKNKGFNYFAAESFSITDSDLRFDIPTDEIDGFYVRQPTFGLLTHYAYLNNYVLCGYDSFSNNCNNEKITKQQCRDSIQAKNIAKIFEKDPKAKIIVFGGHGHINKTQKGDFKPMGFYLQQLLPEKRIVSINQTAMIANSKNKKTVKNILIDSLKIRNLQIIENPHLEKIKDNTYNSYLIHPVINEIAYWYYSKNEINTEKIKLNPPKNAFFVEIIPEILEKNGICVFKSKMADLPKKYIYLPKSKYKILYYDDESKLVVY